jgi:hypothetical protein
MSAYCRLSGAVLQLIDQQQKPTKGADGSRAVAKANHVLGASVYGLVLA